MASASNVRFRVVVPLRAPVVDIVLPVRNDESDIERWVRRLHAFVNGRLPFSTVITIADRASNDGTCRIAADLAHELPGVRLLHLNESGRGRAVAAAWMTSDARIVAAMNPYCVFDLALLPRVIAPLVTGRSEISLGPAFKALRADVARRLIPQVASRGRLFEAELALRATRISISKAFAARRGALYAN